MTPWYESPDGAVAVYLVGPARPAEQQDVTARRIALRNRLHAMHEADERMAGLCEAHGQRGCCGGG